MVGSIGKLGKFLPPVRGGFARRVKGVSAADLGSAGHSGASAVGLGRPGARAIQWVWACGGTISTLMDRRGRVNTFGWGTEGGRSTRFPTRYSDPGGWARQKCRSLPSWTPGDPSGLLVSLSAKTRLCPVCPNCIRRRSRLVQAEAARGREQRRGRRGKWAFAPRRTPRQAVPRVLRYRCWRGGRAAEGAALEMLYTGNRIGGSNPPLSDLNPRLAPSGRVKIPSFFACPASRGRLSSGRSPHSRGDRHVPSPEPS